MCTWMKSLITHKWLKKDPWDWGNSGESSFMRAVHQIFNDYHTYTKEVIKTRQMALIMLAWSQMEKVREHDESTIPAMISI